METINNIAGAASKAIWGTNEANQEPVSGVKGNTNQGEPYDAGNIEDPLNKEKKANVADAHTSEPATGSTATTTTGLSTTTAPTTSTPSAGTTGTTGTETGNEHSLTDRSRATEESTTHKTTEELSPKHKEEIGKPELKHTSPNDVPSADSAAGKTETRAPSDPATDPAPKGQDVNNSASGPTAGGDKLDGPGPRPLEAVAKERGGDAGNVKGSSKGGLIGGEESKTDTEGKKEEDPNASHGEEGTGEKLVKATGLAADGGDFDATKPGAGREADRLLDEKDPAHAAAKASAKSGADKTSDKTSESHSSSAGTGTEKEKESLKDKIKAKLHRH
ncbi:hypothetical protein HER10_EVM0002275 [Colletotrichum scovillei]|uniref:Glycine-rich cell wall structural protein 1 n=1 Tax=Colletotrichum scovillei TaxID=1209932 RepID=A0A9P7RAV2_9PEZI|nr:uncharacterized protein HER10_EVM0002275 [Colletotrichum scovillei]KAF4782727.1 hypothetical protein HER10_EVM0002275 [Colletotrichum scovillei]KAG7051584.1 glycine-rich cell wall structural protein 1 [Colletotrichum scovillei]KAG7070620.1 glycine-rich cell wall structural protein 1 [Colletotrichum scovillei]KAG7078897.1 glycine-rich cell wall structural protein 1 [Colletotrichum scovillei]